MEQYIEIVAYGGIFERGIVHRVPCEQIPPGAKLANYPDTLTIGGTEWKGAVVKSTWGHEVWCNAKQCEIPKGFAKIEFPGASAAELEGYARQIAKAAKENDRQYDYKPTKVLLYAVREIDGNE